MDAIVKSKGIAPILSSLQSRDEEVLVQVLEAVWVIAESGPKYQTSIRKADTKQLVSLFIIIPKLLLHYEENVALRAAGAIAALSEKNSTISLSLFSHIKIFNYV